MGSMESPWTYRLPRGWDTCHSWYLTIKEYDEDSRSPALGINFLGSIRTWRPDTCQRRPFLWFALQASPREWLQNSCYEVATLGISLRAASWTANVQVYNNVVDDSETEALKYSSARADSTVANFMHKPNTSR